MLRTRSRWRLFPIFIKSTERPMASCSSPWNSKRRCVRRTWSNRRESGSTRRRWWRRWRLSWQDRMRCRSRVMDLSWVTRRCWKGRYRRVLRGTISRFSWWSTAEKLSSCTTTCSSSMISSLRTLLLLGQMINQLARPYSIALIIFLREVQSLQNFKLNLLNKFAISATQDQSKKDIRMFLSKTKRKRL